MIGKLLLLIKFHFAVPLVLRIKKEPTGTVTLLGRPFDNY